MWKAKIESMVPEVP